MTKTSTDTGDNRRQKHLRAALETVFKRALKHPRDLELDRARYIIFSDQHRGARNGADAFEQAEGAYRAALAWYLERGFTLVVLGDVEELWEETPRAVLRAYADSVAQEAKFHQAGRYLRVWGNHDDDWQSRSAVRRYLQPLYGDPPLQLSDSLVFTVTDNGQKLGTLFLVHGHQGTPLSDRWSVLARLAVRHLYRPFQRLTGLSLDTPSKNWHLREEHSVAMHAWAAEHEGLVLVAGHTHRPVFESRRAAAQLETQLEFVRTRLAHAPEDKRLRRQVAELEDDLERATEEEAQGAETRSKVRPCYFNTGCCCFPGGDITGLELAEGEIRLVHWPDDKGEPYPKVLEQDSLREVFGRLGVSP